MLKRLTLLWLLFSGSALFAQQYPPAGTTGAYAGSGGVVGPFSGHPSLGRGIIHVYKLEETGASAREDAMHPGSGQAWSAANSPSSAAGKRGNGVAVDGNIPSYLNISGATLFPANSPWTVAFWINITSNAGFLGPPWPLVVASTTGGGFDFTWSSPTGSLTVYPSAGGGNVSLTGSAWHLVVIQYQVGRTSVQTDANAQTFSTNGSFAVGATMFIGFNSSNANWVGTLDEFMVWNRVLTPQEVIDLYNGGTGLFF